MEKDNRSHFFVTGANGFIGRKLCAYLAAKGHSVRGVVRGDARDVVGVDEYSQVSDINGSTDWQQALAGIDIIVHSAARVHVLHETAKDPLELFRRVNVAGTERLARMAAKAGVKRFVFLSSVKVNGEGVDQAYTEQDRPMPEDAYGISKREAEDVIKRIAGETGLQTVILRLPLVYGPGVKANFRNLIRIVGAGWPLPFKNICNQRSFVYVGNAVDAMMTCATHPLAAGETFLVSDGQDVSAPVLITMIAQALGKQPSLFSLPPGLLKVLCKIAGKEQELEKLTGSLCVDSGKIRKLLGWRPPYTLEQGIKLTVQDKSI